MAFSSLEIRNFRCFDELFLDISTNQILFYGKNGCGKTAILESIYVATSGRSFRTHNLESLIKKGSKAFSIKAYDSLNGSVLEVKKEKKHPINIKVNNSKVVRSELIRAFPSFIIDSKTFFYNDNSPDYRRKHLDRGLFIASKDYSKDWFAYFRALKQRNSALKLRDLTQAGAYDDLLDFHGNNITEQREKLVVDVGNVFREIIGQLKQKIKRAMIFENINIKLNCGYNKNLGLKAELYETQNIDFKRKITTKGPHKADITFDSEGLLIKDTFSRGEQKMLAIIWSISQNIALSRMYKFNPILLLDDLSSELDSEMFELFIEIIKFIENRFIFSNIVDLFGSKITLTNPNFKKFHVEQII